VLDRYRLVAPLGVGAFATVWLALDERLGRDVAVKVIPQRRLIRARFEREAWAAARLSHPGAVMLYEAAADHDAAYLVSELVRGCTLEQALAEGRLSDRDILAIGVSLCDVLTYAHAQGIVHRDVKPSNVLIPDEQPSAGPPAKLTDFGVAHAIGGDSLTATGDVVGTAAYMAPEQAAGREVRPPADLYALALVLYEGLTGVNPLASVTARQRGTRLGLYLPPLRRQRRDLPRELGRGIDLALRPRAAERGTITELRGALEVSLPAVSDETGVVGNPWRPPRWRSARDQRTLATDPPIAATAATGDVSLPHTGDAATIAVARGAPQASGAAGLPGQASGAPGRPGQASQTAQGEPSDASVESGANQPGDSPARPTDRPRRPIDPLGPGARGGAAAMAALVTGWLTAHLLAPSPLAPATAALLAAGLLLAVPRLGFGLVAAAATVLAFVQGHGGDAVLVAVGAAVVMLAAPRGRPPWPLAAGAPLLGIVGLAGAWPAVAARVTTARGRAVLGFTGWVWLVLAGRLADAALYLQVSPGGPSRTRGGGSPIEATHQALGGLLSSGALAPAPVWALAAVVLPLLVTRRSLVRDAAVVAVWAGLLVAFTALALSVARFGSASATIHGALVGAIAGGVVAVAPTALAARRAARRARRATRRNRRPPTSSHRTFRGGYTEAGVP
jgi:hypothetical protein